MIFFKLAVREADARPESLKNFIAPNTENKIKNSGSENIGRRRHQRETDFIKADGRTELRSAEKQKSLIGKIKKNRYAQLRYENREENNHIAPLKKIKNRPTPHHLNELKKVLVKCYFHIFYDLPKL